MDKAVCDDDVDDWGAPSRLGAPLRLGLLDRPAAGRSARNLGADTPQSEVQQEAVHNDIRQTEVELVKDHRAELVQASNTPTPLTSGNVHKGHRKLWDLRSAATDHVECGINPEVV
eukprot:5150019-Amphidinium_carterae.1